VARHCVVFCDQTRQGHTYRIAQEHGIATAQLPIGQYLQMASRKVLTVNHVFEILLHYKINGDWENALLDVVPKRKGARRKSPGGHSDEESDYKPDDDCEEQQGSPSPDTYKTAKGEEEEEEEEEEQTSGIAPQPLP